MRSAVQELVDAGIEALTISFLWSTVNPAHERRAREIAREVAPDLFVSCSSDLSAKVGEYERTITAVMNSYIGPLMVEYVDRIQDGAAERGFAGTVQFAQCAGGAITSGEARRAPIRTVQSGPVAGTIATQAMAGVAGLSDVMAVDMGGTTFDVSVIHDGRAAPARRLHLRALRHGVADARHRVGRRRRRQHRVGRRPGPPERRTRRVPGRVRDRRATGSAARNRRSPTPTSCSASSTRTSTSGAA